MPISRTTRVTLAVLLALLVGAGGHLLAQNSGQFRTWRPGALRDALKVEPREACSALVALTGYEFAVISATIVPAAGDAPEFCRVSGLIQPEIRFEVDLPAVWNGRLYMFGNGGYAGEALDSRGRAATALRGLARGFVVTQTNTGHDGATEPLGSFASNPQKFVDYAFRAVHVTAVTAKRVAQVYYGTAPRRSYLRRLFDRRAPGVDLGPTFPGRLRRNSGWRAGAGLHGDDDQLPHQPAGAGGRVDRADQAEDHRRRSLREV